MPSLRGEILNGGSLEDIKDYYGEVHGKIHDGLGIPPEGLKDRVTRIFGVDRRRKPE